MYATRAREACGARADRNAIDGRDDVTQVTAAVQYPDDDSSRDSTRLDDVLSRCAGAAHLSRRDGPRRARVEAAQDGARGFSGARARQCS